VTARRLLQTAHQRGITLQAQAGRFRCAGPRSALTPDLVAAISERRAEVLALLELDAGIEEANPAMVADQAIEQRVEQGGLALPARQTGQNLDPLVPVLVNELEAFEYTVTRAGNVTYAAPGGLHDDCVMALMLAGHAGDGARGAIIPRLVPGTNWRRRLGI
jgi:hypothetical protein